MVGVQSSRVVDCIRRGRIPLIGFEESADGILQPYVIESRSGLRYVALSHVWSGGLGNVTANSMFPCQLRHIFSLLQGLRTNADDDLDRNLGTRKFQGLKQLLKETLGFKTPEQPLLLWIDTLCVPVGSEYEEMRQNAIAQMAQTYVEAQCVLVIDPELQKMSSQGLPPEDLFANVLCSSWNSRSWTFQEACMARVFYVQFADGYCIIDKKWHAFMKRIENKPDAAGNSSFDGQRTLELRDNLMAEVSNWYGGMPVMTKIRGYDTRMLMTKSEDWQNVARVWNGLRTRSTTKKDDLFGIMAIMVDLSAYEILRLDPRERMKAIIRSQSTLPLSLLYQDCTKLCDLEGNPLWAPAVIEGGHIEMNSGYMRLGNDGLFIDSNSSNAACHVWPVAYKFSTARPLPPSFTVRLVESDIAVSVQLCLNNAAKKKDTTKSWLILFNGALSYDRFMHNVPGVLLEVWDVEGTMFKTTYHCPLVASTEAFHDGFCVEENTNGHEMPLALLVEAQSIALNERPIKILSGMVATSR
ncbi:MAG: hypothetical protein Q9181_007136 [Wetmoreana brouardii]